MRGVLSGWVVVLARRVDSIYGLLSVCLSLSFPPLLRLSCSTTFGRLCKTSLDPHSVDPSVLLLCNTKAHTWLRDGLSRRPSTRKGFKRSVQRPVP